MAAGVEDLKEAYVLGVENGYSLTQGALLKKGWSNQKIMAVLNALIQSRACVPTKNKDGSLMCKVREQDVVARLKGLPVEEYQVFCCIEEAANQGIWTADIRKSTHLPQHVIQKAVKNLSEVKRVIKRVTSIQHRNRKVYMLANLEAAAEVAGGSFYNNGEFDNGLVEQLRESMIHVLRNGQHAKFSEIANYVRTSGQGRDLTDDDLRTVLRTLELEMQVAQTINAAGEVSYVWCRWPSQWPASLSHVEELPCSSCPVFSECTRGSGGRISPDGCRYINHWLAYDFEPGPPPPKEATAEESAAAPQPSASANIDDDG